MKKKKLFVILLIVVATLFMFLRDKKDFVVLAFGDSITYGYGADRVASYPAQLEKKMGIKVINAGVPGETSIEGLERIKKLLVLKPNLVILCHGANDILHQASVEKLEDNILQMVQLAKASGANVILVGVPVFEPNNLNTHPLYTKIAKEEHVILESKILVDIESQTALKSDHVHPNAKGYRLMAEVFEKIIRDKLL